MDSNQEQFRYYYALYLFIAHWAGFMATLGFSISMGLMLATLGRRVKGKARLYCQTVILGIAAVTIYFVWRMMVFVAVVNRMLSPGYVEVLAVFGSQKPIALVGAGCLSVLIAIANSILLWRIEDPE